MQLPHTCRWLGFSVGFLLVSCSKTPTDVGPGTLVLTPPTRSLGALGDTLRLVATVHDQHGQPLPDASIVWTSLTPSVATVDGGRVTGVGNGTAEIVARAGEASGSTNVTILQVPAALSKSIGDSQQAPFYHRVPNGIQVVVLDSNGYTVSGAPVSFAVAAGGGYVGLPQVISDVLGRAGDDWVLGDTLGPQQLLVTIAGGSAADTFSATAVAGLNLLSTDSLTAFILVSTIEGTSPLTFWAQCGIATPLNCPHGSPAQPVYSSMAFSNLTVTPAGADMFDVSVHIGINSPPIPITVPVYGDCTFSINTDSGAVKGLSVTGVLHFERFQPGDSIDAVALTSITTTGLDSSDVTLSGGGGCTMANLGLSVFSGTITTTLGTEWGNTRCAVPGGPGLIGTCPIVPGLAPQSTGRLPRGSRAIR